MFRNPPRNSRVGHVFHRLGLILGGTTGVSACVLTMFMFGSSDASALVIPGTMSGVGVLSGLLTYAVVRSLGPVINWFGRWRS
jgi:hypothetical protein